MICCPHHRYGTAKHTVRRFETGIGYVKTGVIDDLQGIAPTPGAAVSMIAANIILHLEDVPHACTMRLQTALQIVAQETTTNFKPMYNRVAVAAFAATVQRGSKASSVVLEDPSYAFPPVTSLIIPILYPSMMLDHSNCSSIYPSFQSFIL